MKQPSPIFYGLKPKVDVQLDAMCMDKGAGGYGNVSLKNGDDRRKLCLVGIVL